MAKKIGVLDIHQKVGCKPQTYIKKTAAKSLVRQLLAVWVIENELIQRVEVKPPAPIGLEVMRVEVVPPINPPGYHCLPYTYPLPYDLLRAYE